MIADDIDRQTMGIPRPRATRPMRELTADLFVSLDGYAKGEHAGPYFDMYGPELERWIDEHLAEPQVLVMGRVTYEVLSPMARSSSEAGAQPSRMDELPKIVMSRTLREPLAWPNARVLAGDLATVIDDLKHGDGDPLRTIGSVSLVRDLIGLRLVDCLRLVVFPIVLGPGGREPMFAGYQGTAFELMSSSVLDGRLLLLEFRPGAR
jgi:dihydrofolate reductase